MNKNRFRSAVIAAVLALGLTPIGSVVANAEDDPITVTINTKSVKEGSSISVSWKASADPKAKVTAVKVCGDVVEGLGKVTAACSAEKKVSSSSTSTTVGPVPKKVATTHVELKVSSGGSETWVKSSVVGIKDYSGWGDDAAGKGVSYYSKGKAQIGWFSVGSAKYFADKKGAVQSAKWVKDGSKHYYLKSDGTASTGWLNDSGKWYYLDPATKVMKTAWIQDKGAWYYLDPTTGAMATGWAEADGTWYLFNSEGKMQTGWQDDGGSRYYLGSDGKMATSTTTIDGVRNNFSSDGKWQGEEQPVQQFAVQESSDLYFNNCKEARAAGYSRMLRGEPGYRPKLDRDNDGIACE